MSMRWTLGLAIAAFIALGLWGFFQVRSFNYDAPLATDFAGECRAVAGVAGPEDLQIDFTSGKAFISSFNRRAREEGEAVSRGSVHYFDIADPLNDASWRDRTGGTPEDFEPLGLHFYSDDNVARLFVVNAATASVDLFEVGPGGDLTLLEQFTERRLKSPNDVVAVGPRAFYVSNDAGSGRSGLRSQLDFLLRRATGRIFYFNGVSWSEAASGLRFANGLAVSEDRNRLYAAETAGRSLLEYQRDPETGSLRFERRIETGAAVDNINIDEDGLLWIGAHPRPFALLRHQHDADNKAPSLVFSFDETTDRLSPVYANDGSLISGSTTAAKLDRTLLIGALYEEKFLICDLR